MLNKKTVDTLCAEELAKLCGGEDFWHSHGVENVEIPALTMSDGPHGLRKQGKDADHLGIHDSITAICFPSAGAIASSFDRKLVKEMGDLLGEECRAEGVHILLGPAINIKRTPLCGRNFEYYSEDPYLTGELASQFVRGVENHGVGTCVKHYAANNQENGRMTVSAEIDERTLREIYISAFERVMQEKPSAVMSSYNKINGIYVGESEYLLDKILRHELGFDGVVISDWYAVSDRVAALKAGLDLEMPGGHLTATAKILAAINSGNLDIEIVRRSAERVALTARKLHIETIPPYDKETHHSCAVRFAGESAVLLRNNDKYYPLNKNEKILFIGDFAKQIRYQGGGSSHINAYRVDNVLDNMQDYNIDFVSGMNLQCNETEFADKVCGIAAKYDKIVVFTGLPDVYESEGYDRQNLFIPAKFDYIIERLIAVSANIGVVLFNGSPVTMPWKDNVKAILTMQLGGEGVGLACANILTGKINPSGRLQESYPQRIQDTPAYLNTKGMKKVAYNEGVFVGYRYYSTKGIKTLYPFGYGLSYTSFDYSDMTLAQDRDDVLVSVKVKNIGEVDGKEVVQVYVTPPACCSIDRPIVELKGFDKIFLSAGEVKEVTIRLPRRAFAYYDVLEGKYRIDSGKYLVSVRHSAEEEILSKEIEIIGDIQKLVISDNTTVGELMTHPATKEFMGGLLSGYSMASESDAIGSDMKKAMIYNAPIRLVKGIAKMEDSRYEGFKAKLKALIS